MKKHYSAGVVVYRKHKDTIEYLLLHYSAGHWDFSKGHMEEGETKEQTALRELKEESGLTATIEPGFTASFSYYFKDYDNVESHKEVYFFVGKAHDEKIKLSDEHQDFAWLPYEQALEKLTYENAKKLLKDAHEFVKNLSEK